MEKSEELNLSGRACRIILDYIGKVSPSPYLTTYNSVIAGCENRKDLRGIRMVLRDLMEWVNGLPTDHRIKVHALLNSEFPRPFVENIKGARLISKIIESGDIKTEEDFRVLLAYVESIYNDDSKKPELEKLNKMLAHYEEKHRS